MFRLTSITITTSYVCTTRQSERKCVYQSTVLLIYLLVTNYYDKKPAPNPLRYRERDKNASNGKRDKR